MSKLDVRALARTIYIGEAPTDMAWLEDYTAAVLDAACDHISYAVNLYDETAAECVALLEELKP